MSSGSRLLMASLILRKNWTGMAGRGAKHNFKLLSPFYAHAQLLDFDARRDKPHYAFVCRMDIDGWRYQQQSRSIPSKLDSGEISGPTEFSAIQVPLHSHPVIERL